MRELGRNNLLKSHNLARRKWPVISKIAANANDVQITMVESNSTIVISMIRNEYELIDFFPGVEPAHVYST
eukprot:m.46606 g.46606  ORF g.46606 m.46606 type:complete len:71 (-) comp20292_c1_seq1:151-363(-)